jgi:hypothetical protein
MQFARNAPAPGDADLDGDVEFDDFAVFQACVTGPWLSRSPACAAADFDGDNDVDQDDFGMYQRCFSGTNRQAIATCGQ